MLSGFGEFVWWKNLRDFKDPLEGFLPFCVKKLFGGYCYFWILAGNGFGRVIRNDKYPNILNTLQVMDFYLKGLDFGVWMLKCWKQKQKFCRLLAAPSEYTGGTQMRVPSGPLGQIWVTQILYRRNPILGSAWSASAAKVDSPRFWPARRFSKFSKSPKTKNIIHNWLGNAKIRHVNTHTIGVWPGASEFHYT